MGSKDDTNSSQDLRIIIVGGGIAGLSAAIALASPNHQITILERSHMLHEAGALISLQPNASKIITRWGLDPLLQRIAEPQADTAFNLFDVDGNLVRSVPLDASQFGAARMLYHRQDLHTALREAATTTSNANATIIRTGAHVTDCDPDQGTVTLANGEVLHAHLIIGADGIKSVLRATVLGTDAYQPKPTGLSAYRLLVPTASLPLDKLPANLLQLTDPAATTMIVGPDRRIIMGPGRNGKLLGIVALVPDSETTSTTTTPDDDTNNNNNNWSQQKASKSALLAAYKSFPAWLRTHLFAHADDDDAISLWQLRDLDPLPTWHRGRVLLIGDAAHAMLPTQGQGASQAVEDAEALQAFFVTAKGPRPPQEVQAVLAEIQAARYERASLIQAYSREQARPGTAGKTVTLDPGQFMRFNCEYDGALDWVERQKKKNMEEEEEEASNKGASALVDGVAKMQVVEA